MVTDIALLPAECPMPTSLWSMIYSDLTKDAIAAAHSVAADIGMRNATSGEGPLHRLTNISGRAALKCSPVDNCGISMI